MLASILTAAAIATATPSALVIEGDFGGNVKEYREKAASLKGTGTRVIVDGFCLSSCTLFLSDEFQLAVCITDAAIFGFHMPFGKHKDGKIATGPQQVAGSVGRWESWFYSHMPEGVQALLAGVRVPNPSAGDPQNEFAYIKARDLKGVVPTCPDNWRDTASQ